jgi:hypothetical protein
LVEAVAVQHSLALHPADRFVGFGIMKQIRYAQKLQSLP